MLESLLLPNRFKTIGWILLIPAAIGGIIIAFYDFDTGWIQGTMLSVISEDIFSISNNKTESGLQFFRLIHGDITNTIAGSMFIAGALMVGFSREKKEDEFISKLRLSSLLWAVWVNYVLLLLAFLFVFGTAFLDIMIYNMFTVLIIFIVRFNYILYKNKMLSDEK